MVCWILCFRLVGVFWVVFLICLFVFIVVTVVLFWDVFVLFIFYIFGGLCDTQ